MRRRVDILVSYVCLEDIDSSDSLLIQKRKREKKKRDLLTSVVDG
jgi:hypothetical protein